MKLKLTLAQIAHPIFLSAFNQLRGQRWLPRDSYWLSKARQQIENELKPYSEARGEVIKALGVRFGEDWLIPRSDLGALVKFEQRMAPLDAQTITLTLNAKLKWPVDAPIGPDEQTILEQYGFIETMTIPEPEDKSECEPIARESHAASESRSHGDSDPDPMPSPRRSIRPRNLKANGS